MGMISRYFERLAARVQGRRPGAPAVLADAVGLRVGNDLFAWNEVRRLEAYKRDAYVGDCLCLAILGPGDRVIEITEASPGWDAAGAAIAQFVPGSMAHGEWMVRLIAATPGQSVAIYPVA
jgi:hypothetical protein